LPLEIQKDLWEQFYLVEEKGMARRIGWDEPCLTLLAVLHKSKQNVVIQMKLVLLQFVNMQEFKHFQMIGIFRFYFSTI
jgi:hypothetical protein